MNVIVTCSLTCHLCLKIMKIVTLYVTVLASLFCWSRSHYDHIFEIGSNLYKIFIRFTTFEDRDWFVANFWKTATNELADVVSEFPEEETFFVNFLREPVDPTGDEDEDFSTDAPKIYEELPSLVLVYLI